MEKRYKAYFQGSERWIEEDGNGMSFTQLLDRLNALETENEKLQAILEGDPNQIATKEQRSYWRHSAVMYADKMEAENAACRAETEMVRKSLGLSLDREIAIEKALSITRERIKVLEEALEAYGNHDSKCLLSQGREGRPTEGGDYETLYGYGDKAKWYRNGERPECTCGFDAALAGGKE